MHHRIHRFDELDAVVEVQQHAVARLHTGAVQRGSDALHALRQLPIAQPLAAADKRRRLRQAGGAGSEGITEQR